MSLPTPPSAVPPSFYPSNCPPSGATPANGRVYRIIPAREVVAEYFLSNHELGKTFGRPPRPLDRCTWCGISVFDTLAGAQHGRKALPWLGEYIATAALTPDRGMTMPTYKPRHLTWWCYNANGREEGFVVVDEG